MRRFAFISFPLLLTLSAPLSAQGWILPGRCAPCIPDRPCPPCGPNTPTVVRTASNVRAELADGVLRYEVTETFVNRGAGLGEADYLFPLPKGAAFQDLKLSINGKLVSGEAMNADQARGIYEEIVRRQRDPALVEWMGYGLLRTRIFPINPGETKKVVVRYEAVAAREGDALRIDYFRGSKTPSGFRADNGGSTSFTLIYPDDRQYGTAYSPTHTIRSTNEGERRRATLGGDARDVTILVPVRRANGAAISVLPYATGRGDGFAMISLSPPRMTTRATPRDVTVVIDVSGSMSGTKIEQAKAAVKQLLGTLQTGDRFKLIDFSTDIRTFRDDFADVTRSNISAANRYVDQLEAIGSTNISGALDEALQGSDTRGRLPLVLFITDGEPTIGERNPTVIAEAAAHQRGRARLFTFGLGADVNVSLVEQLALEGRGTAQFVRPDESVERSLSLVANRLTSPLVTDVRIATDNDGNGVRLEKMLPAGPSDIFAGQDLVVFSRYEGSGPATVTFTGQTSAGPVRWSTRVNFPKRDRANAFVARLWATQRVGYLDAEKRKHGGSSELNDEIRQLGEEYGIPTEFSSYLVQEPGMTIASQGGGVGARRMRLRGANHLSGVVTSAAAPTQVEARDQQFEMAKKAGAQRAAMSLSTLDSLSLPVNAAPPTTSAGRAGRVAGGVTRRQVGTHVFTLKDSIWTDVRPTGKLQVIRVKPFSRAYFDLAKMIPELGELLAIGDRVTIVGQRIVISVTPAGVEQLTATQQTAARELW